MTDFTLLTSDLVISLGLLGLTSLLLYLYSTWTFSTWSQLGIRGPKPLPFLGNLWEFRTNGMNQSLLKWNKQYGRNVGIYYLRTPMLITNDVEIMKEILIKNFSNFTERGNRFDNPLIPYPVSAGLAFVGGEQWRRQRHTMTPIFSSSKLKMMDAFISRCCQNLVKSLGDTADTGKLLDVKHVFGSFTLDIIAGTGFGFETNSLDKVDDPFLKNAKEFFGNSEPFSAAANLAQLFPTLGHAMRKFGFSIMHMSAVNFLSDTIRSVIKNRKHNGKTSQDLLQLMLDTEASDADIDNNPDTKSLSRDEIIAQGVIFFVAGYDTTATTLQYLSYLLALNPDKQEKLYNEVMAVIGDAPPTYENVKNLSYVDSCIRETLRMFPPVPILSRKAIDGRIIQNITIPAGSYVGINVIGLFRDEEFFPDSEKFIPERFHDDAQPVPQLVKDIVFGAGPRKCIGMRLALYEAKMAAVSMIRHFRFVKAKETPMKINLRPQGLAVPDQTIFIGVQRR